MVLQLILGCWILFGLVWIVNMFSTKRTVARQVAISRVRHVMLFILAFLLLFGIALRVRHHLLEEFVPSYVLGPLGLGFTVSGLLLAIWARMTLGGNWSGRVTFKENHELITRGPYRLVRHPIYTAMLLMFLGTALATGTGAGLLAVLILFFSFWIKYHQEEALMIEHFGTSYLNYRRRVKALVPFIF